MATKSIYSISVVPSYNHITNVKGHTCYTAIYLEATIIAPIYSPQEFVLMFVHLCVYVSVCFLGLVGVLQADLNLFFCLFSLKKKWNYNVGLRLFPSPKHEHLMNNIFFYIMWISGCMYPLTWGTLANRMHYGKKVKQKMHCACYFDTHHLSKHWRPCPPLNGNSIPWWL